MRVVRMEEISLTAAQTNTYDLEAMGAHAVIMQMSQDEGSAFLLTGITQPAGIAVRVLDILSSQRSTNHEFATLGVPLPYASCSFTWTGAGARQGRLIFLDRPIRPFGRVVVKRGTVAPAAGATSSPLGASGMGINNKIQLLMSSSRPCHANLTAEYRGTAITMSSYSTIAGATGGFAIGTEIPGPSIVSLDLVNDDGVNGNSINWAILGTL